MRTAAPPGPTAMVTLARGGFSRRVVTISPGERRPFVDADWRDALVVITRGAVDLECDRGGRRRFAAGTMMSLGGLDLKALFNPGPEELVIVAITRAGVSDGSGRRGSGAASQPSQPSDRRIVT